jgi:hypothetical protein
MYVHTLPFSTHRVRALAAETDADDEASGRWVKRARVVSDELGYRALLPVTMPPPQPRVEEPSAADVLQAERQARLEQRKQLKHVVVAIEGSSNGIDAADAPNSEPVSSIDTKVRRVSVVRCSIYLSIYLSISRST